MGVDRADIQPLTPWFGSNPAHVPADLRDDLHGKLVACGRHDGEWEVIWIGQGGKEPRRLVTMSLSEAAEQARTAALAHFAESRLIPEAELQFAIYPWDYGKMAPMYDITAEAGQYRAHDIVAGSPDIAAPTLEELVEQMAVQPRGSEAMLRWVRRFQDLPTAATG
jgi:hypothetical protein